MRRIALMYAVNTGEKLDGKNVRRGIWPSHKDKISGQDVQIFDVDTGEIINGAIEVRMEVSGAVGVAGKIKCIVMMKNPQEGQDVPGPDGKTTKAPSFLPVVDNRNNFAYTEEECAIVELAPMSQEFVDKIKAIRDKTSIVTSDIKQQMEQAADEADLTK